MMRLFRHSVLVATLFLAAPSPAAPPAWLPGSLPPMRQQEAIREVWLKIRLERVLPALMRKHGIPMWIVANREYNEDPVFLSLVSPSAMAARRRTILVFFDRGPEKGVERLALGGGGSGGLYTVTRDPEVEGRELWGESQWALLRKIVDERKPEKIAVDISRTHAFSDGLSSGEREALEAALGPWTAKLVRAELLPLEYLETRPPEMLPTYRTMQEIAHAIIARAFSSEVITPGKTTTEDVVWWMRQTVNDLGLGEWFPPDVDLQRPGMPFDSPLAERKGVVIERGDVLHCDFGIRALGLVTDTQHMAYVLKEGETDAPEGLKAALRNSNRLQDLLLSRMKPGKTGNEVLALTLAAMKAEGIDGSVSRTRSATTGTERGRSSASGTASRECRGAATWRSSRTPGSPSSFRRRRRSPSGRGRRSGRRRRRTPSSARTDRSAGRSRARRRSTSSAEEPAASILLP